MKTRYLFLSDNKYECSLPNNNRIQTTYLNPNKIQYSFLIGALIYLIEPIQLWCILISVLQWYFYNSMKSLLPLTIFTLFMAYLFSTEQNRKWQQDQQLNNRSVNLVNGPSVARSDLKPGDQVLVDYHEEVPADLILIEGSSEFLLLDESQVSGETKPIKKIPVNFPSKIEIDLESDKIRINDSYQLETKSIIYSNSRSIQEGSWFYGIVIRVGHETVTMRSINKNNESRSPIHFYKTTGFLISVIFLIGLSILNTIISIVYQKRLVDEFDIESINIGLVWVSNLLYLNMMVPQTLEQLRYGVCHLQEYWLRSKVHCNQPMSFENLGFVTRILSDKTGTLTMNKMKALELCIINKENPKHSTIYSNQSDSISLLSCHDHELALQVMLATNGIEPEENAIFDLLKTKSKIRKFPKEIQYESDSFTGIIQIIHDFGFLPSFLAKAAIYKIKDSVFLNKDQYILAIQAGGDELWNGLCPVEALDQNILSLQVLNGFLSRTSDHGAPRNWSHGYKMLSHGLVMKFLQSYQEGQDKDLVISELFQNAEILSKLHIVDLYRPDVQDLIYKLSLNNLNVHICTGDAMEATLELVRYLNLPEPYPIDLDRLRSTTNILKQAISHGQLKPRTFLFSRQFMTDIKSRPDTLELFQTLLNQKTADKYRHFAVFYRTTPEQKSTIVELMKKLSDHEYILSIGDGYNDLGMLKTSDVSIGILSGETEDICNVADFWTDNLSEISKLILKDGIEKASLLSQMVKFIFLKHWMTAFILLADLVYWRFPLYPVDPNNPLIMVLFNGLIFAQIASHTSSDKLNNLHQIERREIISIWTFFRWCSVSILTGFFICYLVHGMETDHFSTMIQVGQYCCITMLIIMSTHQWKSMRTIAKKLMDVMQKYINFQLTPRDVWPLVLSIGHTLFGRILFCLVFILSMWLIYREPFFSFIWIGYSTSIFSVAVHYFIVY